MASNRISVPTIAAMGAMFVVNSALAGSHTWDISEVFSNADGSIQFVELIESLGGATEINLLGLKVTSQSTGSAFTFPSNLVPPPSNKHILLATQSFADLPGAPTPDHIIPANFFSISGDTLRYHIYDTWVISAGTIPTDCVNSLDRITGAGVNTPTNYLGGTGQVDAWPERLSDLNGDNIVDTADLGILLGQFGGPGTADINNDNTVDTADLGIVLGAFGSSCM